MPAMAQYKDEWRKAGLTTVELAAATGVNIASMEPQLPTLRKNRHGRYTPQIGRAHV